MLFLAYQMSVQIHIRSYHSILFKYYFARLTDLHKTAQDLFSHMLAQVLTQAP